MTGPHEARRGGALGRAALCGAALALWAAAVPALAQGVSVDSTSDAPIEIVARDGIEWNRETREYIARGDARATQGETTVEADTLTAFYRQAEGRTEVFRYEAKGNVRIYTPTHRALGDRAVYDIDTGALVLTGQGLKLTTPAEVITARDGLEYWEHRNVAVARGDAQVAAEDGRRMKAELLTAHFAGSSAAGQGAVAGAARSNAGSNDQPAENSRRLQRVEGFGDVHISTPTEIVVGDRGVYDAQTGIAILAGNVRITRGQNQLVGDYAEVNTNTGVSRLLSEPAQDGKGRVRGLFIPESRNADKASKTGNEAPKQ